MEMTRREVGAAGILALFSIAASKPKHPQEPQAKEPRLDQEITTFLREQVQICLDEGGCIAIGRVQQVEAFHQGTRGARVRVHIDVARELQGTLPRQLSFVCFGGPGTAKPGQWLLFAVGEVPPGTQAAILLGFIPVPEERSEEVVRLHQQVLDKARTKRSPGKSDRAARPEPISSKEPSMKKPPMIDAQVLRDSHAQGASVALVRVVKLEPGAQETRSAKVYIHLEVERLLQGELPRQLRYWAWGSLETVKLAPRLMIVTLPPFPNSDEIQPRAVVEVPDGLVEESVQAHQRALQQPGTPPAPTR